MSTTYRAVLWNRQKKIYDRTLALAVLLTIGSFVAVGAILFPSVTAETLIIRSVGTTAFLLLHVVLCIGPLCRLDERFLPLLYNRRHMGVCMFLLALIHGGFSIVQFHALGDLNPIVSVLVSNPEVWGGAEMAEPERPFYVGYADDAPPALAGFLRPRIFLLVLIGPILLAGIAFAQKGFVPSLFEFGVEREFVGWISAEPVPSLVSLRPGNAEHCGAVSTYPLVTFGKFGADDVASEHDGHRVRIRGTLVHVDDRTMIELAPDGVTRFDDASARPAGHVESLGRHRLEGEIVDSKCYYGVMNPGSGKVHRACAARCISGGVPPSFLVRDADGGRMTLLLVDELGRSLGDQVLSMVGRPVGIEGEVIRHDDLLVFQTDPATIERLAR